MYILFVESGTRKAGYFIVVRKIQLFFVQFITEFRVYLALKFNRSIRSSEKYQIYPLENTAITENLGNEFTGGPRNK